VEGDKKIVISARFLYEILFFKTPRSLDLGGEISIVGGVASSCSSPVPISTITSFLTEHGGGEEEVDPHRK